MSWKHFRWVSVISLFFFVEILGHVDITYSFSGQGKVYLLEPDERKLSCLILKGGDPIGSFCNFSFARPVAKKTNFLMITSFIRI